MYPDLSYLFHDIFGTQPDNWTSIFKTFGVMLVVSILFAALFFYLELKRKADEGLYKPSLVKTIEGLPATPWDIASNAIFGFILGFKFVYIFQHFADFQKDAADVLLSMKGNWLAGIAAAIFFGAARWRERKKQVLPKPKEIITQVYPHDRIGDLTIMAAVTGIIGAKVFAILEEPSGFFDDPIGTFFSGSGLAIYGGLIGGYLGVTWYMRKHNIPFWPTADAVAPALIISYGLGRIGCQLSGDGDWGIDAAAQPSWWFLPDWFWAYDYPHNVNKAGIPIEGCNWLHCTHLANPVYPTPLYEMIAALAIGAFLWSIRKRVKAPGIIFFTYLILNGFERFWIEKIRVNVTYKIAGFEPTQAEIIAVILFIIGVIGVIWRKKAYANTTA
ncbi:MAG: prolipoprotein diacylglyceryl transferase [Saprospiraceae bacterium]|nr:prolipoprotein diacylglyceryl transferase [Saprospiraceae bacterium]